MDSLVVRIRQKRRYSKQKELLKDGVQEMDIVMNIGKLKNKEYDYVLNELKRIVELAKGKALVKVIIEINTLDDKEMFKACDLVIESGADFVKTGTGWVPGPGGANIERIRKLKKHLRQSDQSESSRRHPN